MFFLQGIVSRLFFFKTFFNSFFLLNDFDVSAYASDFPGIVEFNRLGKSKTVGVIFQTDEYLHFYITHGIKFGYELFQVERGRIQPRRCVKRQSFKILESISMSNQINVKSIDQGQNQCKSARFKCARCSGNQISTRLRCPILKKFCK